jgi:hypothetical protein
MLVVLGDDHLVRRAFLAGLEVAAQQALALALAGVELRQRCWAAQAQAVLRDLGVVAADGVVLVTTAPPAEDALQSAYVARAGGRRRRQDPVLPRCSTAHARRPATGRSPNSGWRNHEARCALAQLRVGTHWLHVDTGRRGATLPPAGAAHLPRIRARWRTSCTCCWRAIMHD